MALGFLLQLITNNRPTKQWFHAKIAQRELNNTILNDIWAKSQCAPDVSNLEQKVQSWDLFFLLDYNAKQIRMNQEKHLLSAFPLSYQLTRASQVTLEGRLVSIG